eukprot:CAMPEP_0171498288 /NCGR_PEP_ID=MMETSP0958-20121227/7763_1 /TAXON_ID=87120 /ORGANISM="Aurantiochytrium limacinum, Strain ATCCMYA-1381" /LENGTH=293 /DNA_ID=CAMNT_0012032663 /DNA_START=197 /DNA_END=1078 /DNA_ORIENTATION=-
MQTSPKQGSPKLQGLPKEPMSENRALLFAIGGLGGMAGSLMGLGGGFIVIPLLTGVAKFSQHYAHATSLAAVAATSFGSGISYFRNDSLDPIAAATMAFGAILTVRIGARYTENFGPKTLKRAMGLLMVCAAPVVAFQEEFLAKLHEIRGDKPKEEKADDETDGDDKKSSRKNHSPELLGGLLGLGSVVGFLSGFLGIGGGIPMMAGLSVGTHYSHYEILGTSLAAMCVPSLLGTFEHYRLGNITPRLTLPVVMGTVVGSFLGGELAIGIPEKDLKNAFGVVIGLLGLRSLFL